MRWTRGVRSGRVEDRRGAGGSGGGLSFPGFGGGGGGGRGAAIGGIPLLLLVVVAAIFFGGRGGGGFQIPTDLSGLPGVAPPADGEPLPEELDPSDPDAELADFVGFLDSDIQTVWEQQFEAAGRTYEPADVVLFDGQTPTACGLGDARVGPFYCPGDATVYLDLGFFQQLASRFDAPGDFAIAYVVAHEIGHHTQNVLGTSSEVTQLQQQQPDQANELSVRLELQADCLAGVWAHATYERELLESGDLEEGLAAAAAVGDDRIQSQATGQVNPETWTHGSSEQRVTWFRRGFDSGDPAACDTFSGSA